GEVVKEVYGKTVWVNSLTPQRKEAAEQIVDSEFEKHYSIRPSNYVVEEDYLKKPLEIRTGGF
ncbi:MAG: formylmethanofuran dehydrogenase subunit A, partial [Nitrososphaeria archaeon]